MPKKFSLEALLKAAVVEASGSWIHPNGQLDLFLRFLLGISLESNQTLLQGLLTKTVSSSMSIKRTVQFIKDKIQTEHLPADKSINLFLCLHEMKDQSFYNEIEEFLQPGKYFTKELSAAHCSVIAHLLQMSDKFLNELDPRKYSISVHGRSRLVPAVGNCRKALFAHCNLTPECCESLASVLSSDSPLRKLDVSNNDLQDSGVELLSAGLKSSLCKLQILRIALCNLTEKSVEILASVLQSASSVLRELDLSNNDLDDLGVKLFAAGLESTHCKLEVLRLSGCMITEEGCSLLASVLKSNPSHLKELDLSYNHPGETGEKLLYARLADPHCKLETLNLEHGEECRIKPGLNKYTCELRVDRNSAHTELTLNEGKGNVTCGDEVPLDPDHPERFEVWQQVLCKESLSGRHYWEVHKTLGWRVIAVTYKGINRKGDGHDSKLGCNKNSWCLGCYDDFYSVMHNNQGHTIAPCGFERIGVYLDWSAGTLSFYSLDHDSCAETQTHLHTFHCRFTEPLYAGFGVDDTDNSVSLLIEK